MIRALLVLFLLSNTFAIEKISFPLRGEKANLSDIDHESEVQTFPAPLCEYDGVLYFLDTSSSKIQGFDTKGKLKEVISLQSPHLKDYRPFSNFKMLSYGKLLLISQKRKALILWDRLADKTKVIADATTHRAIFNHLDSIQTWQGFVYVNDVSVGQVSVLSRRGSLLERIQANAEQILPVGPLQVLSLMPHEKGARLLSHSIGKTSTLADFKLVEGDDHISLRFVGTDELGNIYLQKIHGSDHGLGRLALLKLSPTGRIIKELPVALTKFEYQEFDRFFFVSLKGQAYQFQYAGKGKTATLLMAPIEQKPKKEM